MFTKEAIDALQESAAIAEARLSIDNAVEGGDDPHGIAPLPNTYTVHDLEKMLPHRRRARGTMKTSSVPDFAAYVGAHAEWGAAVFVDQQRMAAVAVLNLGAPDAPGHADNRAEFAAQPTAAYRALLAVASGQALKQQAVAEFLEDWAGFFECFHEGATMTPPRAIASVRKLTLEAMRKLETTAGQLSEGRSTFEQVRATSGEDVLPTHIYFTAAPYQGLEARTFVLRLGIRADEKAPGITLRIVNAEQHAEELAKELARLVRDAVTVPVMVGSYTAA